MKLRVLEHELSVCKVHEIPPDVLGTDLYFIGKTDEELSLVCVTDVVPPNAAEREDGWRAFRVEGVLDFTLVGVLAKISAVLAAHDVGIFVVSTYNTDYVLVKSEDLDRATKALAEAGYEIGCGK